MIKTSANYHNGDANELFSGRVDRRKAFTPYSQQGPLSEILTSANPRHAASRV